MSFMNKLMLVFVALAFLVLPFVNADLIPPGFHSIPVVNNITNFNDFNDYYLLDVCSMAMHDVSIIENGIIEGCYKLSKLSVYAVKKTDFNISDIEYIRAINYTEYVNYFKQDKFIEVLSDIEHYKLAPLSSTADSVYNEYVIDISKLKTGPDNSEVGRNNLIYFYIFVPLVALIAIVLILIFRKRKNAPA